MLVIWKAFCEYLKEKVSAYKGVNVKGLGTFTFEVSTSLPRLGIDFTHAKTKTFQELLMEKKNSLNQRVKVQFIKKDSK